MTASQLHLIPPPAKLEQGNGEFTLRDGLSIVVSHRDDSVAATVDDDGHGFDPATVRDDALGLVGMRERLALVGGTLEIESSPGRGTTVAAQVPLAAR